MRLRAPHCLALSHAVTAVALLTGMVTAFPARAREPGGPAGPAGATPPASAGATPDGSPAPGGARGAPAPPTPEEDDPQKRWERANAPPNAKQIDAAIDKGVAYLISRQKADGSWEEGPRPDKPETVQQWVPSKYATYGGETAIATYALLAAGQSAQSEPVKKAVDWLEHVDVHGTYAVALRAQVWNLLPEAMKTRPFVFARDRDRDYVFFGRIAKGANAGFYTYTYGGDPALALTPGLAPLDEKGQPENTAFDRSNSQYAVLGAWALEQAGAELPLRYWEDEDRAWRRAQRRDGSWDYNGVVDGTMVYEADSRGNVTVRPRRPEDKIPDHAETMTCAGVATLYITQDFLARAHSRDNCNGGISDPAINAGLAWLEKHMDRVMGPQEFYHYALFGVERIGFASGRKTIGGVDWFERGSRALVQTQAADGSWNATVHDTAYGVVFLVRGRAPVMMNKLAYGNVPKHQTNPWNERPRDAANLSKWMGKRSLESFVSWQLVDLKTPVEELHDAPILYISGSEPLSLSDADCDKLRLYVQQGGMILGNADCGRKAFANSFKQLGTKLFPHYEFRLLPPGHPIFSEQYLATKWKIKPQVLGLSNGVRELMVLVPESDAGHAWQTDSYKAHEEPFQLGGNLFLYATGKENLRRRGEPYVVTAKGKADRSIPIARLMLGDNPDPEPGGWTRLAAILQNDRRIGLEVSPVKPGTGDLAKYKIAHWTGTAKVALNEAQRKELKDFVAGGGTLIVDAAGGAAPFAESADSELRQTFGDAAAKGLAAPLPATHPIYTDPRWKIGAVSYRTFARRALAGRSAAAPRIRAILSGQGRVGVFYSAEDLSAGLVGEPVDGIFGYEPAVATQLMRNLILYADAGGR